MPSDAVGFLVGAERRRREEESHGYSILCSCSHVEDSHYRVGGNCRSCKCRRFVNDSYLDWWEAAIRSELAECERLRKKLADSR